MSGLFDLENKKPINCKVKNRTLEKQGCGTQDHFSSLSNAPAEFVNEKTVKRMAAIAYREFYDVPRMIIVMLRGSKLLLDCKFDEALDKYPAAYQVYELPLAR